MILAEVIRSGFLSLFALGCLSVFVKAACRKAFPQSSYEVE